MRSEHPNRAVSPPSPGDKPASESTLDALNNLTAELHGAGFKDAHRYKVENFTALGDADKVLDQLGKAPA